LLCFRSSSQVHPQEKDPPQQTDREDDDDEDSGAASPLAASSSQASIQSPFIDAFAPLPLPRFTHGATSGRAQALIKLNDTPVPTPLQSAKQFAFLTQSTKESLVLPVTKAN
jgi:hypothetical protein